MASGIRIDFGNWVIVGQDGCSGNILVLDRTFIGILGLVYCSGESQGRGKEGSA